MRKQSNEPGGCLAFLFGFGGSSAAGSSNVAGAGDEGNYHSGPSGYEGGSYAGGYATEYRAEQDQIDEGHERDA